MKIEPKYKLYSLVISLILLAGMTMNHVEDIHGKVVCFGDSITHGAKVEGHSWVYFLNKNHPEINFVNAGRNGRKTADKMELLPVLKNNPDANYYLIFLGVNDLKDGTEQMVNDCVNNMQWMINKIRLTNADANILILAPTDINLKTMAPINVRKKYNENTKESLVMLKNRYKKLADKNSVEFLSLLDTVSPPNYVDGLHPDTTGQKQIADAVWQGMNRIYGNVNN